MWLLVLLLSVLCVVILCSCVDSANRIYLRLLERLFGYCSRLLRNVQLQRHLQQKQKQLEQLRRQEGWPRKEQQLRQLRMQLPPKHAVLAKDVLNERLEQCCDLIAEGLRLVLEDEVTPRFAAAAPPAGEWNLLTRNLRQSRKQLNWRLYGMWLLGLLLRYTLLVPLRTVGCCSCIMLVSVLTSLLGQVPEYGFKRRVVHSLLRLCFRLGTCCIPVVRRVHNVEHRPQTGICVCNHTSPVDVLMLMCDVHYSLTGQRHDGILGVIQRALARASPHMWFERRALSDRESLGVVLRLHATVDGWPPVLLFPEGTCINNTAVMRFKKGSFAICNVVHPVAMRYDRRYGDAFWDSTRSSMLRYILMLISSWTIICDIWYMPAVTRLPGESSIDFASRVKAVIAAKAGIEDLPWDGNLKRWNPVRDW